MKNTLFLATVAVTYLLNSTFAHATVGGPTLIDSIQYSSADKETIIYEQQSLSGKGCPPEVYSIDLPLGTKNKLISCSDADWTNQTSYNARLESILAKYPSLLKHINLSKNNISVQIIVTDQKAATQQNYYLESTDFRLDVYQNGEKKSSYIYSGCSPEQLHIIEGYIIPNVNILVLLISSKGDCFEGGYAREVLYTVPNIILYNQNPLPLKNNKEATSEVGNLSLFATQTSDTSPVSQEDKNLYPPQTKDASLSVTNTQSAPIPEIIAPTQSIQTNNTLEFEITIGALIIVILVLVLRKR